MHKTIVVNIFGGPSAGKSTTSAGIFYELKRQGIRCELVTEYAKSKVWEESYKVLEDQIYIFGKQNHKMFTVKGKVDIIITDSPLLLSLYYGKDLSSNFKGLIVETHNTYHNMNYFINNLGEYDSVGRMQTEEESLIISGHILDILKDGEFPHTVLNKTNLVVDFIIGDIYKELAKVKGC